jgi:hydrogenase maturation protease
VNLEQVERIAEAVLYEGYMLYPYRISSIKNRQRWNFGVLYPPSYCERCTGAESNFMQTECLVKKTSGTRITVNVRFLQIVRRSIGKLRTPGREEPEDVTPDFRLVNSLEVGGRVYQPWQEAFEREVGREALNPEMLSSLPAINFEFPERKSFEYLSNDQGVAVGVIERDWERLSGTIQFNSEPLRDDVIKVTARVENQLRFDSLFPSELADRRAVLHHSFASAHTILGVENGEFVSLLDPPEHLKSLATHCKNIGTWPVLAGEQAEAILSSPIILYDHPQIAPESAGNLFDSTEIDEILSLRILTLTDDEKREMRQCDDRSREILDRTENMQEEQIMKLHGVLRGLTPLQEEAR